MSTFVILYNPLSRMSSVPDGEIEAEVTSIANWLELSDFSNWAGNGQNPHFEIGQWVIIQRLWEWAIANKHILEVYINPNEYSDDGNNMKPNELTYVTVIDVGLPTYEQMLERI